MASCVSSMPFYTTDRLQIYAEQAGRGPDVLVLNGTGSDLRMKPNIMDSPLTSRFRVTAFDQRGLGQTDKPAGDYSMADYADDAAALMQALDLNSAMVLGISFGGMVAQELALRHPDRGHPHGAVLHRAGRRRRRLLPAARAGRPRP